MTINTRSLDNSDGFESEEEKRHIPQIKGKQEYFEAKIPQTLFTP